MVVALKKTPPKWHQPQFADGDRTTAALPLPAAHNAISLRGVAFLEKRREARYPTHDAAEVELLYGTELRLQATVLDVSKSGLRLELDASIGKGMHIKITLRKHVIIFGEVCHCRRARKGYQAGILIENVFYSQPVADGHINDDGLALYLIGKGLSVLEVITIRDHLVECEPCRIRLAETYVTLKPVRRRKA